MNECIAKVYMHLTDKNVELVSLLIIQRAALYLIVLCCRLSVQRRAASAALLALYSSSREEFITQVNSGMGPEHYLMCTHCYLCAQRLALRAGRCFAVGKSEHDQTAHATTQHFLQRGARRLAA